MLSSLLLLLTGCTNPCVDYCKKLEAWLEECGTTWEAEFADEGWTSVEDCYDDHWEAETEARKTCTRDARQLPDEECY